MFSRHIPGASTKLHRNQVKPVNDAIRHILSDSTCGEEKNGDLTAVRVYKFRVLDQQFLLAYAHDEQMLFLLGLGVHENFYRDLKGLR